MHARTVPLLACLFAPLASAQLPIAPVAHAGPYATQLSALHFPGGEAFEADGLACIVSLPSGAVVVGGSTNGSLGEAHAGLPSTSDMFVARFDPQGALVWLSQVGALTAPLIPALNGNLNGPGGDASGREWIADLAIDSDGSILVTGGVAGSLGETGSPGSFGADAFVARFSASGTLQWLRQLGLETAATLTPTPGATVWGDVADQDVGQQIVIDSLGGFWVAGSTLSSLVENNGGEGDLFLAHHDSAGHLDWLHQLGAISGPALGFNSMAWDTASGLALSPFGALFMAVTSDLLNGSDIVYFPRLLAFDLAGGLRNVTPGAFDTNRYSDIVIGPAGRIFIAAETDVFIAELSYQSNAVALCYDPNGTQLLWRTEVDASLANTLGLIDAGNSEYTSAISLDRLGNVIVSGYTYGSLDEPNAGLTDIFAMKLRASDGMPRWIRQLGATTSAALGVDASSFDSAFAASCGPRGTFTLCGSSSGSLAEPSAGSSDAVLIRLGPSGDY